MTDFNLGDPVIIRATASLGYRLGPNRRNRRSRPAVRRADRQRHGNLPHGWRSVAG
jgi:hypothetical protein